MSEDIEQIYKKTEQYGRIQFVKEIAKSQCKEQQLISWLEDKIKEYKLCFPEVVKALQEVLDFVRGGKDE